MSNKPVKPGSPELSKNILPEFVDQVVKHCTAIVGQASAMGGFVRKMAEDLVKKDAELKATEKERDCLLVQVRECGECETCANNAMESKYEDCSGACSQCDHTDCECNGCDSLSKWTWAGPIHGE